MDRFRATEADAFFDRRDQKGTAMNGPQHVLLGRIVAAHGLKGDVVVHSFTAVPEDIAAYGPLLVHRDGKRLELEVVRVSEKGLIARIAGIGDRTAAEALKGTELWIERERLPPADEGEFYYADLIGLAAVSPDGQAIGRIVAVENFGAGDLLEVRLEGSRRTEFVPFTDACVPEIDLAGGRVVVQLPTTAGDDGTKGGGEPD